jgi:hypothetical protein
MKKKTKDIIHSTLQMIAGFATMVILIYIFLYFISNLIGMLNV